MNYKCQNCGSPLVFEEGQDRTICKYCRSQNLMTVGTDGQITLSLVQTIHAIDDKTGQLLAMQKTASMGHLLSTATSEYQQFLQNEFRPRMVMLEEERDKTSKFPGSCILAATLLFCLFIAVIGLVSGDLGTAFVFLCMAAGIFFAVRFAVNSFVSKNMEKRKSIQAKMDALTQKRTNLAKQNDDLKKSVSGGD